MMLDDGSLVHTLPPQEPVEEHKEFRDNFDVSVSSGEEWITLSDGYTFWISPEGFGQHSVSWRRQTAQSRYYDGEYLLHASRDNVQETLSVYVRGDTQNDVTESLMLLEELFSQFTYRLRVQFGDHRETWYCQPADWQTDRGHVLVHNHLAKMTLQVPRLPQTTKEIIL